jgi:alpha-glucuronidase
VYSSTVADDRAKQAYDEFVPLDGAFADNVLIQVKNGPIDFQPREPFHPLFGALRKTPLAVEFQLTQEYLGFASHLVYLAPLLEECLSSDTFARGKGSTVDRITDGSLDGHRVSAIAAVSNIGNVRNWCGHPFAAANWFAYGRLAWDPSASAATIADEWIRMTFGNDPAIRAPVFEIMLGSRETTVSYMTPLGLHHIMGYDHHYGPAPWIDHGRPDWTSVYYHRADGAGIGFDRSPTGSNAVSQYAPEVAARFASLETCPEPLLLWFHHVAWTHVLGSGRTLWQELCSKYQAGVDGVRRMIATWETVSDHVDRARFQQVRELLLVQEREARWWRDACLLYFQTFSRLPLPDGVEGPERSLEHYRAMRFPDAPGI